MKILVIDDEKSQREILADILSDAGYSVTTASSGEQGLEKVYTGDYYLVLTDLKMPDKDGIEVLDSIVEYNPDIQVVLMTAFGTIPSAVNAIKKGAYDYLTKPFQKADLLRVIKRAAEKSRIVEENQRLREAIKQRYSYHNLVGNSSSMQEVFRLIDRIKNVDATVLITGESGTGKELVARAIHYSGKRKDAPFVTINCGAIPENLIESELFGHEKGSFTGATTSRSGKFEQAHTGTIFLDEISAMPLSLQVRLLRVLQEKSIERVGGKAPINLDVRVIAATNDQLWDKVEQNQFRADLYHRLNVFNIHLPPLSERRRDIPLLVKHFLEKFSEQYHKQTPALSPEALNRLENYDFPGNVRELSNILEKTIILSDQEIIAEEELMMPQILSSGEYGTSDGSTIPGVEREMIVSALKRHKGSVKNASTELGISYKTLQYRIKKYGIQREKYR